jgi:CubicO group peptidase (beta-lactamase class C family)
MILERATGKPVADYLGDRLWTRIGSEFDSSWSLDRENGFEKMESGINARAIDFAKLGRLYLAGGSWDGEQIVPAQWVDASTTSTGDELPGYYPATMGQAFGAISHEMYWWRIDKQGGTDAFSALGNHGQLVFVQPDRRLIIVRLGERYGISAFEWFELFSGLEDRLSS